MYLGGVNALPLSSPTPPGRHRVVVRPYKGVTDSVKYMRKFAEMGQAHPDVRVYTTEVIRQVTPKDYMSEIAAIYYDVCRTIRYTRDPANREFIHHPAVILQRRAGDCDDMSVLLKAAAAAASAAAGAPVEFVVVGFDRNAPPESRYTHVFVRVLDTQTGQWMILDPVAGPNTRTMVNKVKVSKSYPT